MFAGKCKSPSEHADHLRQEAYLGRPYEPVRHILVDEDGSEIDISEEQLQEWRELLRRDATVDKLRKWLKSMRAESS